MKTLYLAGALAIVSGLGGCVQPQWLADANARFEQRMNQYPGGALGWGLDAAMLGNQIQVMRGR